MGNFIFEILNLNLLNSAPKRTRTSNLDLRRVLLFRLSYGRKCQKKPRGLSGLRSTRHSYGVSVTSLRFFSFSEPTISL